MRLRDHELEIKKMLVEARVDSPGLCARLLTALAAGIDSELYIIHSEDELSPQAGYILKKLAARRAAGEPLAYILGKKDFYDHSFLVSKDTLTPRPETELLVDLALTRIPPTKITFLDAGCGSGCIGLSLLAKRPLWRGILMDLSMSALQFAARNASKIAPQAELLRGDIFGLPFKDAEFDLLISNPPYISKGEWNEVMPEVLAYEPHMALFSENEGLAHIEALARGAMRVLKSGGLLMFEHGAKQKEKAQIVLEKAGFVEIRDYPDLSGLSRCAMGRKP